MPLQFILGSSGSGKSRYLYETVIKEYLAAPKENFLILVPEQFTMEIQRNLTELHPRKGILNIDVLSFQRLALRVLEDLGADRRRILEETGKNLVIRRAAMEHRKELTLLGGSMEKNGYISQVKSMISELAQYRIEPETMDGILESLKDQPRLYYKWKDIGILYHAFQEQMAKEYVTAEELLEVLAEHAGESRLLSGCTIALDGYTGFTPIQLALLKKLLPLAKKIQVTVTVDPRTDWGRQGKMHELFYLSQKTIQSLTNLCKETGTELLEPVILGRRGVRRFEGRPALAFLESHLFRTGKSFFAGGSSYPEDPSEEISIHACADPREEAEFAARTILSLRQEKGLAFREIALISGDMETYAREIRRIFPKYGIPCFIDETKRVLLNPFLEFIKAALEMLIRDFSYIFLKNQRLGIIGPNGCGKSTLLRMLIGEEQPDNGTIEVGETIKIGYFAQETPILDKRQRVIDYIKDTAEYIRTSDGRISASQMLERFLFDSVMQYTPLEKLSGGELRRLYLCKVLMEAPNVLILDEPTNDLDIPTLTILEDYLDSFVGIIITVSHDRYFLDNVVDRIFAFEEDGYLQQYEGGYTEYREMYKLRHPQDTENQSFKEKKEKTVKVREKKLKFSYKEQREFETIDEEIAALEDRLATIEKEYLQFSRDFVKLGQLEKEKAEKEALLEEKMERWEYLNELAEAIEAQNTR